MNTLAANLLSSALRWNWLRRTAVNHFISRHGYGSAGKMTQLKIDPTTKHIDVELQLTGEPAPITIHLEGYSFEPSPDGSAQLAVQTVSISKPWMETIAKNLTKKPLTLPKDLAQWLKLVL